MGTTVKQLTQNMLSKEYLINEINKSFSVAARFAQKQTEAQGLYFYYYGGTFADTSGNSLEINDGSVLCVANSTNYVEYNPATQTVVVNQVKFTDDYFALAIVTTNATSINTNGVIDKRLIPLLPTGKSPILGGGGATPGFGDLTVTDNTINNPRFTVKGGVNWQPSKEKKGATEQNVPDYSITNSFSALNPNTTYYVVFDPYYNSFTTIANTTSASGLINVKIMYVITTTSTTFSVKDYRAQNYFQKAKTLMGAYQLGTTATNHAFNMSQYYYYNQVANDSTMTVGSGLNGVYPRFVRAYSTLLCISAELDYQAGEEADYITTDGTFWGKPLAIRNNGNIEVFQGSDTKVYKSSTKTFESVTPANWAIVVKVELDYQ